MTDEQPEVCECVSCCDGEHPGECMECAGWGENSREDPCSYCDGSGDCPKCNGANRPEATDG
jgi:hypothetical protein